MTRQTSDDETSFAGKEKDIKILHSSHKWGGASASGFVAWLRGHDMFLWRNAAGGFGHKFSSRVTWNRIRVHSPTVSWSNAVWFKEEIPRCYFIIWLAINQRLPTKDRLISWGMQVPDACFYAMLQPNHISLCSSIVLLSKQCGSDSVDASLLHLLTTSTQPSPSFNSEVRPLSPLPGPFWSLYSR